MGEAARHELWVGVGTADRVWTALGACLHYLGVLVWPAHLSAEYWRAELPIARSPLEPSVVLALVALAAGIAIVVWTWRRAPAVAWGLCFFWLALFPVSNLPFPLGVLAAERLLYAPSAGFVVAVSAAVVAAARRFPARRLAAILLVVVVAALGTRALVRNRDWHDNETQARATLSVAPDAPRANTMLGLWLSDRGRAAEAEPLFRRALAEAPDHGPALNGLGLALRRLGRPAEAAEVLEHLRRLRPDSPIANANLIAAYGDARNLARAREVAEEAVVRCPDSAAVLWNAANVWQALGRSDEAERLTRRARELETAASGTAGER